MNTPLDNAEWIASHLMGGTKTCTPAPYFRREFPLGSAVKSGTLHATALGVYEAEINGQRVGDLVFAPGWTSYHKRVPVHSHDVTELLKEGDNALGFILGDGWFSGSLGWYGRQVYGERPELRAALVVELEDGTTVTIPTDRGWKTGTGPILESDFLQGETYDARREIGGWSSPGFDEAAWGPVQLGGEKKTVPDPTPYPPVRRQMELPGHRIRQEGNHHVFDFKQNITGRVRVRVKAEPGVTLDIKHGERLRDDGWVYTGNLRGARATDHYTCKGGEEEVWEPRFTFPGFQYVEVTSHPKAVESLEVTGIVLHSDMARTGEFSCSNPLLNQLQSNIQWGQRGNFLEVPTDCPQRDERLGWTGDAQVFIRTAAFNFNVREFFHKWMRDVRDDQYYTGAVDRFFPCPRENDPPDAGPGWSDATVISPWTVYLCYGDKKILADHYDSMTKWHRYVSEHLTHEHIRSHPKADPWGGHGDWLALDGSGDVRGATPFDLIGTAYYAHVTDLLHKIARLLGRDEDAMKYAIMHEQIVTAFRQRFVTDAGFVAAGTQTAYALALKFGLIPEDKLAAAAAELARLVAMRKDHIATGFLGTPYLMDALSENGQLATAYKLLEQETFPSWLFPVTQGATTIWERWNGWTPEDGFEDEGMNSFNHYAYGAVGEWMYKTVAGLDLDEAEPAYKHIVFRPRPGGSLTHAQAALETPQGRAAIAWKLGDNGVLTVELEIPEGSRATFTPPPGYGNPDGDTHTKPGQHTLTLVRKGG